MWTCPHPDKPVKKIVAPRNEGRSLARAGPGRNPPAITRGVMSPRAPGCAPPFACRQRPRSLPLLRAALGVRARPGAPARRAQRCSGPPLPVRRPSSRRTRAATPGSAIHAPRTSPRSRPASQRPGDGPPEPADDLIDGRVVELSRQLKSARSCGPGASRNCSYRTLRTSAVGSSVEIREFPDRGELIVRMCDALVVRKTETSTPNRAPSARG